MKKLIVLALLFNAALILARVVHDVIADAQGVPPIRNGDVNGDRSRDISDAIYLLDWLFVDGPEPVALADSPELEGRVADLEAAVAALQGSQSGVGAAVESLALLLGDPGIAKAVPPGALQPLDRTNPFILFLDGDAFGEVIGVHIVEEVSSLPMAHVAVRIPDAAMDTDPLLGLPARLEFLAEDRLTRFVGEVVAAGFAGRQGRGGIVRLSIAPRLHRLDGVLRSRMRANVTALDVVTDVLGEHGLIGSVSGSSGRILREHVFQYNETDFDFVSRLLEEEGIYYFFEHDEEGHEMVMADTPAGAPEIPGVFPYRGHQGGPLTPGEAYIQAFHSAVLHAPASVQVRGWDYRQKRTVTGTQSTGATGGLEDFFLGQRTAQEVGIEARNRRDRALADAHSISCVSTVSSLRPGHVVTIGGVGSAFDGKYFVTGARHTAVMVTGGGNSTFHYGNVFRAIPSGIPFRPEPRTPRPRIDGMQTAIVTDNKDPDRMARVKVKFPWLEGAVSQESGWVRLSQPGAGKERGTFWLPEVDDEVLVSFAHGDPHHPVIVGGLWNGQDDPPETPTPGNDRRLFKSRSGHLLVFDDTEGAEGIAIQSKSSSTESGLGSISIDAESTQVRGLLASSTNAGPAAAVHPGDRHRDNSIVAWASVSAAGAPTAPATLGIAQTRRLRTGAYRITLSGAASSVAELIPIVVAGVSAQPMTAADVRIASVDQVDATNFDVFINSGLFVPIDGEFVFMATAR